MFEMAKTTKAPRGDGTGHRPSNKSFSLVKNVQVFAEKKVIFLLF